MAELLLKAIDYLLKLLEIREKRLKENFSEFYVTLFADLNVVNEQYVALFKSVRAELPMELERFGQEYHDMVTRVCHQLIHLRQDFQSVRERTAVVAMTLARQPDLSDEERAFLDAVCRYLPSGELGRPAFAGVAPTAGQQSRATRLIENLYAALAAPTPLNPIKLVDEAIAENSRLWKEVCHGFILLKTSVLK